MTSREFCYWLQGYFEIAGNPPALSEAQTKMVRNHLNLVFKHEIDPSYGGDPHELQEIHDGGRPQHPPFSASDTLIRC